MGTYTQTDIMAALDRMNIAYKNVMYKLKNLSEDAYFEKRIRELLSQKDYDGVFSVNYFPVLADICKAENIPYLSWSYDSPLNIPNIEDTLGYQTNFVFFFDYAECEKYWKKGYENIYHLPLAVDTRRLDAIVISKEDEKRYAGQISMVGQLYNTSLQALLAPLGEYERGFMAALIQAQFKLYGGYFLEKVITQDLVDRVNEQYAAIGQTAYTINRDNLIVAVAKHITHMERVLLLDALSDEFLVNLYGPGTDEELPKVRWRGSAGYQDEMPKVFKLSDINLNVSLKCIQSGIPLRALDIMGCGGFLVTNWQAEIAEYFEDGVDVVMYTSLEEAVSKCRYYMEHEEERRQIAENGYRKVKELFRYEDRLSGMLQTAGLI